MRAIKTAAVWIEDGVFAVVFLSHCGAFGSSTESSPPPGICHPRQKENANARGQEPIKWAPDVGQTVAGGGWGEEREGGMDAAGID